MNSRSVLLALVPLFILGGVVYYLMGPGTSFLYTSEPLPDVTIENAEFKNGEIIANVRNTGQDTVTIAQADINDDIWEAVIKPTNVLPRLATAQLIMKYPWIEGVPYEIGITTSDGTRFAFEIEAAALTPEPNAQQLSYFAILGSYVGVVPVMIGLLWFPFMSRISKQWYSFFLSLTAGLLVFLALDALKESFEVTESLAGAFRGEVLIVAATAATILVLMMITNRITTKTVTTGTMEVKTKQMYGLSLSYMVAIGIGLHNLGEGLAIGAAIAIGSLALSKFLVIGFTIHNTTEGLAIIAPIARHKARILHLLALGLIAGVPTIAGTWIGGFTYMPVASILFLAVGAGAIFQVVYSIFNWMNKEMGSKITAAHNITGFIIGLSIMYLTGLLIAG
ncbi:MAG: ZIP family metal transporter [Nitrososphaerales archaeon]